MTGHGLTRARPPAVAGSFYPSDPAALAAEVDRYLAPPAFSARRNTPSEPRAPRTEPNRWPKALVVPHAGYRYSGSVAGEAYARLAAGRDRIERIVLIGPAHRVPVDGVAASSADAFLTPLGPVEVDREAREMALTHPLVVIDDLAHAAEHSVEVHLPFLQRALTRFRLLPLVAGRAPASAMADLLDALWGGPETVVIVSTDLSHYHDNATAVGLDQRTAAHIMASDAAGIRFDDACGAVPLRGLLVAGARHHLDPELIALRNSADTGGPLDRVVGYGAFAFSIQRGEP